MNLEYYHSTKDHKILLKFKTEKYDDIPVAYLFIDERQQNGEFLYCPIVVSEDGRYLFVSRYQSTRIVLVKPFNGPKAYSFTIRVIDLFNGDQYEFDEEYEYALPDTYHDDELSYRIADTPKPPRKMTVVFPSNRFRKLAL